MTDEHIQIIQDAIKHVNKKYAAEAYNEGYEEGRKEGREEVAKNLKIILTPKK